VSALLAWVEQGSAPREFIASSTQGVALQRPLCPYPSEAVYNASGNTTLASSFHCTLPLECKGLPLEDLLREAVDFDLD
jgi:feruloyl esterase